MDICLNDLSVSRGHQFTVTYDHHDDYYCISSTNAGRESVRVNNERLRTGEVQLHRGDIIGIADTILIFIPFDSEDFQWKWN